MAIDSMQKRMSAIAPSSPWRGPLVDATESGFNVGNRQAADFMYSGISASTITAAIAPLVNRSLGDSVLLDGLLIS